MILKFTLRKNVANVRNESSIVKFRKRLILDKLNNYDYDEVFL
jgi:hypothetical protein